jgi:hypothetical protein
VEKSKLGYLDVRNINISLLGSAKSIENAAFGDLEGGINKQRGSNVGNAVVVMQQLDEL